MNHLEVFQVMSEVTLTFTGLAGVVSLLGRSSLNSETRIWRLKNIIVLSLIAFFVSLVPQAGVLFEVDEETVWRLCSSLILVLSVCHLIYATQARSSEVKMEVPSVLLFAFGFLLNVIGQLYNLNLAIPGIVYLGLCWLMLNSTIHFFVLVSRTELKVDA